MKNSFAEREIRQSFKVQQVPLWLAERDVYGVSNEQADVRLNVGLRRELANFGFPIGFKAEAYFFSGAFFAAPAQSPATTVMIFSGSIHFRRASRTFSGVNS